MTTSTQSIPSWLAYTNPDWNVLNFAIGGSLIYGTNSSNGMQQRTAIVGQWIDKTNYTRNVVLIDGGRNDVTNSTAEVAYARLVALAREYVRQGAEVYCTTLIDTLYTTYPTPHNRIITLNGYIRASLIKDTGIAGVIDLAANPHFDPNLNAAADPTYYLDATHLTPVGNQLAASIEMAVLKNPATM